MRKRKHDRGLILSSQPRKRRLALQSLEQRSLMAADVSLAEGYVQIHGTDQNDVAEVYRECDRLFVNVSQFDSCGNLIDQAQQSFALCEVKGLCFQGQQGDDVLVNDSDVLAIALGGPGNDLLIGGRTNDLLVGEEGNDTVLGREGNDILMGSSDQNVLLDASGADTAQAPSEPATDAPATDEPTTGDTTDNPDASNCPEPAATTPVEAPVTNVETPVQPQPCLVASPTPAEDSQPTDEGITASAGDEPVVEPPADTPAVAETTAPADSGPVCTVPVAEDEVTPPVAESTSTEAAPTESEPVADAADDGSSATAVLMPVVAQNCATVPSNTTPLVTCPPQEETAPPVAAASVVEVPAGASDILVGGDGHDLVFGGEGDDMLFGDDMPDELYAQLAWNQSHWFHSNAA